jgi:hypothetical protein
VVAAHQYGNERAMIDQRKWVAIWTIFQLLITHSLGYAIIGEKVLIYMFTVIFKPFRSNCLVTTTIAIGFLLISRFPLARHMKFMAAHIYEKQYHNQLTNDKNIYVINNMRNEKHVKSETIKK